MSREPTVSYSAIYDVDHNDVTVASFDPVDGDLLAEVATYPAASVDEARRALHDAGWLVLEATVDDSEAGPTWEVERQ